MSKRSRKQERRALIALASAALAFLGVQQAGGWLLRSAWPQIRFPGLDAKLALAQQAEPKAALFFGSSRFGAGVSPTAIVERWAERGLEAPRPVNLSVPAGDFVAMEHVLRKLKRRQPTLPPLVVLEASPETLGERTYWLSFHVSRQFGWPELPLMLREQIGSSSFRRFLLANALPLWRNRDAIRHELLRFILGLPERDAGLTVLADPELKKMRERVATLSLEGKIEDGVAPMRRWFGQKPYRIAGVNVAALDRMLDQFGAAGCKVVLVGVPVCAKQRKLYTPAIEAEFQAALAARLQRHPNLRWIDARALIPDDGFADNHHLARHGALRFSGWLAERLLPDLRPGVALGP